MSKEELQVYREASSRITTLLLNRDGYHITEPYGQRMASRLKEIARVAMAAADQLDPREG
jgi:hypothetical protein